MFLRTCLKLSDIFSHQQYFTSNLRTCYPHTCLTCVLFYCKAATNCSKSETLCTLQNLRWHRRSLVILKIRAFWRSRGDTHSAADSVLDDTWHGIKLNIRITDKIKLSGSAIAGNQSWVRDCTVMGGDQGRGGKTHRHRQRIWAPG